MWLVICLIEVWEQNKSCKYYARSARTICRCHSFARCRFRNVCWISVRQRYLACRCVYLCLHNSSLACCGGVDTGVCMCLNTVSTQQQSRVLWWCEYTCVCLCSCVHERMRIFQRDCRNWLRR
ncbi:unnamed protein product [Ectocarpus sp. 12 AP-2014]